MSDYILLKQPDHCPICAYNIKNRSLPSCCPNCGIMLFKSYHDFEKYETETGWREYWVYFGEEGWKHRTHILDFDGKPVQRKQALSRSVAVDVAPVTQTPKEKIAKIKEEVKAKQRWYINSKKKIRSFGK